MTGGALQAAGGLGLFLLGMTVLQDGLRRLAGDRLREYLARATRSPASGAVAGAASTAVVQSSSATTVAAVGFVGAGLLTFEQALGLVCGASLGTTATGWLVALLGFKLDLATVAAPLVLFGVLLDLLARRGMARLGRSLAGFGLVFVGIAAMQAGMEGLRDLAPMGGLFGSGANGDGIGGQLLLVGSGALLTVITQSSSAGVAAALVALHAGTISLPQATALVVGMNVGTSGTAWLASLGAAAQARRTAVAHVVFNVLTSAGAFLLLRPYSALLDGLDPALATREPELCLVAFHTGFNALGLLVVLPFAGPFARLVERLVPERGSPLARRLDAVLLRDPGMALEATRLTLEELAFRLRVELATCLQRSTPPTRLAERAEEVDAAAVEVRDYLSRIEVDPTRPERVAQRTALLHLLDHVDRLARRCQATDRARLVRDDSAFEGPRVSIVSAAQGDLFAARTTWEELISSQEERRSACFASVGRGELSAATATARSDALRWILRVTYHLWRIAHYREARPEAREPLEPE